MDEIPLLDVLLKFHHVSVIKRYIKDYPQNKLPPEVVWKELLCYFWLLIKHQKDKRNNPTDEALEFTCVIHGEMREIDDMWHTFLLFTREYADFCEKYFGHFIHHVPNTGEQPFKNDPAPFERYLAYIYDNLGEETLKRWFSEYFQDEDP